MQAISSQDWVLLSAVLRRAAAALLSYGAASTACTTQSVWLLYSVGVWAEHNMTGGPTHNSLDYLKALGDFLVTRNFADGEAPRPPAAELPFPPLPPPSPLPSSSSSSSSKSGTCSCSNPRASCPGPCLSRGRSASCSRDPSRPVFPSSSPSPSYAVFVASSRSPLLPQQQLWRHQKQPSSSLSLSFLFCSTPERSASCCRDSSHPVFPSSSSCVFSSEALSSAPSRCPSPLHPPPPPSPHQLLQRRTATGSRTSSTPP